MEPAVKVDVQQGSAGLSMRMRREFRGNRQRPVLYRTLLHHWQESYRAEAGKRPEQCARVRDKYETRLNAYGYSLQDLSACRATDITRPYMLRDHLALIDATP